MGRPATTGRGVGKSANLTPEERAVIRDRARAWRARNPEKCRVYSIQRITRRVGLSVEQYVAMREAQQERCSICGEPANGRKARKLHIDHDHRTGKVRALLCNGCNRGLGFFEDNIERLRAAIKYLEDHNE